MQDLALPTNRSTLDLGSPTLHILSREPGSKNPQGDRANSNMTLPHNKWLAASTQCSARQAIRSEGDQPYKTTHCSPLITTAGTMQLTYWASREHIALVTRGECTEGMHGMYVSSYKSPFFQVHSSKSPFFPTSK